MKKYLDEHDEKLRKLFTGEIDPRTMPRVKEKTLVMDIPTFYSTFTPERIRLLQVLKHHKVTSISKLARILKRPYPAVHRDVMYLCGPYGLLTTEEDEDHKVPKLMGKIHISIV